MIIMGVPAYTGCRPVLEWDSVGLLAHTALDSADSHPSPFHNAGDEKRRGPMSRTEGRAQLA